MTENKRFIIDDAGTLIDIQTRNTYDYVSDVCPLLNALNEENEQLKQREQTLTAKIDRILHQRDGNEKQHLKVMSYLHDNYYSIWEECLKELGD